MRRKFDEKFNRTNQSFFLKWDTADRRAKFNTDKIGPYSWKQREELSQNMTTRQILDTVEYKENHEKRRIRKWKEIRHFWSITHNSKDHGGNLENAFWVYGNSPIPVTQFVMVLAEEFKFKNDLEMENHFRWLYWSLDGGKEGIGDWRELLSATKSITYFRMVKRRPEELLLQLFDIYSIGAHQSFASRDDLYITDKNILLKIFLLPVISAYEQSYIEEQFNDATVQIPPQTHLLRPAFKTILLNNRPLVKYWADLLWKQLPPDLRITALDEIEYELIVLREEKLMQFLWTKSVKHSNRNIYKGVMKVWKKLCVNTALIKRQRRIVFERRRKSFFYFWRKFSAFKHRRRRRRVLAEVMGNYTLKARSFARIKLFNYINNSIVTVVGHYEKSQKIAAEAFARIRYAWKKHDLRTALRRWHRIVAEWIQDDTAIYKYQKTIMLRHFKEWKTVIRNQVNEKTRERIALENQNALRDMMIEIEHNTAELVMLEKKKQEEKEQALAKAQAEAQAYRLKQAKQRAQAEKQHEQNLVLAVQRDVRRRVVAKQMKEMKRAFNKEWKEKEEDMINATIQSAHDYFMDKANKVEIEVRFERLKKEFFSSPLENKEREKIITSVQNIVFLYLEAKMIEKGLKLKQIIPKFDLDGKGYLTYLEFRTIVNSLECRVSENQITEVIKGVDSDGDGFINMQELEAAMGQVSHMGVESSPWRFYVDPAQDVLCYHNFKTGIKVLEHNMTKEIFMDIVKSNLTAEYINNTKAFVQAQREADWDQRLKEMMARRIQNMAHLWFGRRARTKFAWKLEQKRVNERSTLKQTLVTFIGRKLRGFKARYRFEQQLHCTWEKVWDTTTQRLFWFNHQTNESTWDKPRLLMRYGDVENPHPWIYLVPGSSTQASDDQSQNLSTEVYSYWHVPSQTSLPRKPDGYPLCHRCLKSLATRLCVDCEKGSNLPEDGSFSTNYCFACYRETHASPFDFLQLRRPNKLQRIDTGFMLRLSRSYHKWERVKLPTCLMCNSTKLLAAYSCEDCQKTMCRPCFRRIHSDSVTSNHNYFSI